MLDKAPYQTPSLDAVLHTKLQTIKGMRYARGDIALKTVALVGMLLPDQDHIHAGNVTDKDLYGEDLFMLGRSFNALAKADIPLHPEATFQIYNILPPVGSDYLLAALDFEDIALPANDLSILMYLPKYGTSPSDRFYMGHKGFRSFESKELYGDRSWRQYTSVSHLHHSFNIWAQAADRLGAKLVMTHGGVDDEITTQEFEGHPAYHTLIDSEANQIRQKQSGRNNMGVAIHKDAITAYAAHTDPQSQIGAALQREIG